MVEKAKGLSMPQSSISSMKLSVAFITILFQRLLPQSLSCSPIPSKEPENSHK